MLSVIIFIALFIIIILVAFVFLRKLSGSDKNRAGEEEVSQEQSRSNAHNSQSRGNARTNNMNLITTNSNTNNSTNMGNTSTNTIRTETTQTITTSNTNTSRNQPIPPTEIKPLTKKDMQKLEKKKAKEEAREYQRMVLEEKKLREQEKERIQLERDMKRDEERRQEEEAIRRLKEEQEKKENEIFDQWKDQFIVAEEGEEVGDLNDEDLINDFINYVKLRKVVSLEDLSGVFKINPNDIVDRLNLLESQGRISGIVDDRGKYIYLTDKELAAIEKIFMQRGRISKVELIKECNKIIRFIPTEEDKLKIMEEQSRVWKTFEDEMEKGANVSK